MNKRIEGRDEEIDFNNRIKIESSSYDRSYFKEVLQSIRNSITNIEQIGSQHSLQI